MPVTIQIDEKDWETAREIVEAVDILVQRHNELKDPNTGDYAQDVEIFNDIDALEKLSRKWHTIP